MPLWRVTKSFGKWLKTQTLKTIRLKLGARVEGEKCLAHWMIVNTLTTCLSG
jgi:hypothetical protein